MAELHRKRVLVFEHRRDALLPPHLFLRRVVRNAGLSAGFVIVALAVGMAGYHGTEGLSWLALFSGVAFLTAVAVLFAPLLHRFLHRFHLDFEQRDSRAA